MPSTKTSSPQNGDTPAGDVSSDTLEPHSDIALLFGAQCAGESITAVQACNDWLLLGYGRSLRKLLNYYSHLHERPKEIIPPMLSLDTLKTWSSSYAWEDRAVLYDYRRESQRTEMAEAEMKTGLALPHVRVAKLKELYHLLSGQLREEVHPEEDKAVRTSGSGEVLEGGGVALRPRVKSRKTTQGKEREPASRYRVRRRNAAIVKDLRGLLQDVAKETAGHTAHIW